MSKRYFKREWEEEYYIFDSEEILEEKVDEEIEYGYEIFADAMQGDLVVDRLNEQEQEIQELDDEVRSYIKALRITLDEKDALYKEIGFLKARLQLASIDRLTK